MTKEFRCDFFPNAVSVVTEPLDATRPEAVLDAGSAGIDVFPKPKHRTAGLISLAMTNVIDGFEGGLVTTLFPVISAALGLTTAALGLLAAIGRFSRTLLGPVWAALADRFGRKRMLVGATVLAGLWTAAAGLAQNSTQLFVLYAIGALGTVAAEPITNGLVVDLFGSKERGRAFGVIRTVSAATSVIATPIIGQFANIPEGWRLGMFVMGGIGVVSGVLTIPFVHEPAKRAPIADSGPLARPSNLRAALVLLRTPTIGFMASQVILVTSIVIYAFFITFYVQDRGWTTANAAILLSVYFLGAVFSSMLGGVLGDQFEKGFGLRGRVMLMQGYLIVYAVSTALLFQIDWGHGAPVYIAVFVAGLLSSIGHPGAALPIVGSVVPRAVVATAYALIFSFVQGLFATLLALAFGFLAVTLGLQALLFWLVSVPYAINAVLWTVMYRIYPKDAMLQRDRDAAELAATKQTAGS